MIDFTLFRFTCFCNADCVSLLISQLIGFGIVFGSILIKLPQIAKLVRAKSGEGVSITSSLIELLCVSVTCAYGRANDFPFGTWGEAFFIGLQNLVIASLLFWYARQRHFTLLLCVLTITIAVLAYAKMIPIIIVTALQCVNIPMVVGARLIQIRSNFINKSTGQLSLITAFLVFGGSIARIFTSVRETGDLLLITAFTSTTVVNGALFAQFFIYWKPITGKKTGFSGLLQLI